MCQAKVNKNTYISSQYAANNTEKSHSRRESFSVKSSRLDNEDKQTPFRNRISFPKRKEIRSIKQPKTHRQRIYFYGIFFFAPSIFRTSFIDTQKHCVFFSIFILFIKNATVPLSERFVIQIIKNNIFCIEKNLIFPFQQANLTYFSMIAVKKQHTKSGLLKIFQQTAFHRVLFFTTFRPCFCDESIQFFDIINVFELRDRGNNIVVLSEFLKIAGDNR